MSKSSAGILAVAVLLALIAGSASKPSSVAIPAGIRNSQRPTSGPSSKLASQSIALPASCEAKKGTFAFELIDAVKKTMSRGPVEGKKNDQECLDHYSVDPREAREHLHVVFAIVPDPVHTNLSLFFDRQIDAIQQGAADNGWYFERALLPWDNKEHPEPSDFRVRVEQKVRQDDQEDEPGLMIFHHGRQENASVDDFREPPDRLLMFMIPESPTAGVQKIPFRRAVKLADKFFGRNMPADLSMPIFGPTFSGSLQSLAELLLDCKPGSSFFCTVKKSVFSGTVTGITKIQLFKEVTCVPFYSLQENDAYVLGLFVDFAKKTWRYSDEEIVTLSEDETLYGAKVGKNFDSAASKKPCRPSSDPLDIPDEPQDVSSPITYSGPVIYFPRGISQLRGAYQHNVSEPAASGEKAPRTTLPLDLESRGSDDYTVPDYSGKQYPLSQEAILLGIVRKLRQDRAQVIVLRATDPLDLVFLSRYLRQAYPDGRIITISSDLLFSRELQDTGLHGVMALCTYPLTFGANPEPQRSVEAQADRIFPSTHSAGSYNAIKLLLAKNFGPAGPIPECPKVPTFQSCVHLHQYRWPDANSLVRSHPPVYLNVLGHEGYWPVAILPSGAAGANEAAKAPSGGPGGVCCSTLPLVYPEISATHTDMPHSAPGWALLWVAAVLGSLAYCYFIWSASMLSSSQAVAQLAPARRDSRRYVIALTAYLHFAFLMALLWVNGYQPHSAAFWPEFCLIASLLLVVVAGTCDLYRRHCLDLAILFVLATVLTPILLRWISQDDYFHRMSYYRSIYLASGVSDLLPVMLFLSAALWGVWYSLSGSSLVDSNRTRLPKRKAIVTAALEDTVKKRLHSYRGILEEDQVRLKEILRPDYIDYRAALLSAIVILPVLLYTGLRPLRTFEPIRHEYLIAMLASACFAFLIAGAVRLYHIWIELRQLLIALDNTPLRQGFRHLKGFSWSPLWRLGGGNLGGFRRLITLQAEALRCAFNLKIPTLSSLAGDYRKQAEKTQKAYEDSLNHHLEGPPTKAFRFNIETSAAAESVPASHGMQPAGAAAAPARIPAPPEPAKIPLLLKLWPLSRLLRWLKRVKEQHTRENQLLTAFKRLQEQFARVGLHALAFAVTEWDAATSIADDGTNEGRSSGNDGKVKAESPAEIQAAKQSETRHAAERFLALLYTSFIMIVLVRIRTLIITIAGMYVLCLLALTTYPFQPQVEIRIFLVLLLVFMIALVGIVYAQMHRDATLINITNIEPGQLRFSFWLRMTSFIALPVFSLMASQYPEIGNLLYSWLEPALNALK